MPGPLPSANKRRRNAPTIQTTNLPAAGRKGRAPKCPYSLHEQGLLWWRWAWATPQATKWDQGSLYAAARRAQLEDDLAALDFADHLDLSDLLGGADEDAARRVKWALSALKRSASGSVNVMKEMRELDKRLGLDPKALAELRWVIAEEEPAEAPRVAPVRRLRAVEA
jgi:hypothetical protein